MKSLIVYASATGNTKVLATALYNFIQSNKQISDIQTINNVDTFDILYIGYWNFQGGPCKPVVKLLQNLWEKDSPIWNNGVIRYSALGRNVYRKSTELCTE